MPAAPSRAGKPQVPTPLHRCRSARLLWQQRRAPPALGFHGSGAPRARAAAAGGPEGSPTAGPVRMEDEELEEEEYTPQEEGKEYTPQEEEEEEALPKQEEEEEVRKGPQHPLAVVRPVLAFCSLLLSQVPTPDLCPLTEEVLKEGLSLLSKTGNGLAHAYVKFEAKSK